MALPTFSMRQLLEAGVHFGHRTRRWNPKMGPYLFGVRNDIHIIDLQQTVPLLHRAMMAVRDIVAGGGRVLFVGTKRQASEQIAEAAKRCGQYYVNHRWLGGMMTNWRTISNSIKRLREVEEQLAGEDTVGLTKKETLRLHRERDRLDRALGGIKEMGGLPDVLFVIDTNREDIAVAEANKIGIPVVGVVDSNSDPAGIDYPIPGNDDAIRAIHIYCDLVAGAVLDGIQAEITASGGDPGEGDGTPAEAIPAEEADAGAQVEVGKAPSEAAAKSEEQVPAESTSAEPASAVAASVEAAPVEAAAVEPATDGGGEKEKAAPTPDEVQEAPPETPAESTSAEPASAVAASVEASPVEAAAVELATDDGAAAEKEKAAPTPEEAQEAPPQAPAALEPSSEKAEAVEDAAGAAVEESSGEEAPSDEKSAVVAASGGETDKTAS